MGKLTLDNIQFIETYLKNSGINFVDVRMEMTDHIASSIETEIEKGDHRDFYYIFKDFMAVNKKSLLKSYDKYYRLIDLKILKRIFKFVKPYNFQFYLLLFLTVLVGFSFPLLPFASPHRFSSYRCLLTFPFLILLFPS